MDGRRVALVLGMLIALLGTEVPLALAQDEAASPSAEVSTEFLAPAASFALVESPIEDIIAVADLADLLDETGEPDREAVVAALGGWSALILPGLTELAGDDPGLLALLEATGSVDTLEAALQAELATVLEDVTPTDDPSDEGVGPMVFLSATLGSAAVGRDAVGAEGPAGRGGLSGANMADLAVLVNFMKEVIGPKIMDMVPAFDNKEVKDGVNRSQSLDLGGADGQTVVAIEFEKDGQKVGGSLRFRLKGDPCPDADGTVRMEFKVQRDGALSATAGSLASGDGFDGTATGHVDDSATLTGFEYAGRATARTAVPGRSAWVETTNKGSFDVTGEFGTQRETLRDGLIQTSRWSSQAETEDRDRSYENGRQINQFVARVLGNWQGLWRSGWCVKINADIPATVQPSSTSLIEVKVVHKDGSELDEPVEAALSGTQALEPLRIEHAPGTFTYTAGVEPERRADLTFTSTSRRGIGKLTGTVWTEKLKVSYQARSIPGVRTWTSACIDALDRGPIVLEWKDATPGHTSKGVYTLDPTSETEGTLTGVLTGKGPNSSLKSRWEGSYRIEVSGTDDDGSPSELLVVHSMKGSGRYCAGGRCHSTKYPLSEGTIPLDVVPGSCPVAP
jgi:hypothetical protein